jgi:predicted nucleotidyltransferase
METKTLPEVQLLFNALDDPDDVLINTDKLGPVHEAISSELARYAEPPTLGQRAVVFVSPVGSINYELATPKSDLDCKAVYLPSLSDFYYHKFQKFSMVSDRFDCELHPAHDYMMHMLKGNINFFEPVYSDYAIVAPEFSDWWHFMRELVEMNVKETALASFWMSYQCHKGVNYIETDSDALCFWDVKKASHAIRCLVFTINLVESGEINIVPASPLHKFILRLKQGEISYAEYVGMYKELDAVASQLVFIDFHDKDKRKISPQVMERDERSQNPVKWDATLASAHEVLLSQLYNNSYWA